MPTTPAATILYVEDDAIIREVVAMTLEDAGFEVIVAPDAPSAIGALKVRTERPVRRSSPTSISEMVRMVGR